MHECDDALWAYWNNGIAVRCNTDSAVRILNSTIGTDGFHVLGAPVMAGRVEVAG